MASPGKRRRRRQGTRPPVVEPVVEEKAPEPKKVIPKRKGWLSKDK